MHTLRILLSPTGKTLSMKLDLETIVYDICRDLYTRISKHVAQPVEDFGLFVPDADSTRAYWLDNSKPVCYYPLTDKNLVLEFKSRIRRLIITTMDGTKKTLEIDDSKTIAELILPICNKMGISNHEEYSLIFELDEEEKMKTLTLKKGKNQIRDFEKMEKMKQKLKTDDELNWLPHAKTLRQLGITDRDELLLRRKYFFSDQNVDARDPIQLNLLYVQLKNAIIDGTHPVSIDEAIQLAGIQCQAELGNCSADKQKTIHSNIKDYLPKEYVKTKGTDKKIYQQYEKLTGKSDKEAKVMYAELCRSLKTYGITFFLVKEKVKAKNKLVPRLLGISKENVMRVDERTKEIVQSWPLTTVRRYAATASLFSLDFGDYSDENYVIQTMEGEKIAQLIAGYIDIIIKKQKVKENLETEVDEETAMIEENVAPSKANVVSHNEIESNVRRYEQNSVANLAQVVGRNAGSIAKGEVSGAQSIALRNNSKIGVGHVNASMKKFEIRDLTQPKRALMTRIGENLKILKAATEDLDKHIEVTKLGNDESSKNYKKQTLDITKNKIKGNLMSMTMATGYLLSMVRYDDESDDFSDYARADTAITTIGYTTERLLENVRKIYEVTYNNNEDEQTGGDLINAAKQLLNAFEDLLVASKPVKADSDSNVSDESGESDSAKNSNKSLLDAVNKVGEASRALLQLVTVEKNQISEEEWEMRDMLLSDAKQIANSVSAMVKLAKEASVALKETQGIDSQATLIQAAKLSGQATSTLISAAKVVACSPEQPSSQQQLRSSGRQVKLAIEDVIQIVQSLSASHQTLLKSMNDTANGVYENVDKMLLHLNDNSVIAHQDQLVTRFLQASERLPAAIGNRSEMVTQAQILAQAGSDLASCLNEAAMVKENNQVKTASSTSLDPDRQRRLMIAAQALTDAVGRLVHATKICLKESDQTTENQQALMQAAHHMTSVAHMTAGEIIRQRVSKGLEFAGRQTALTADQLVLSSQEASKSTRVSNYQLTCQVQDMADTILPEVVLACTRIRENPIDTNAQNNLLDACQKLIKSLEQLLSSCEALGPRVQDSSIQSALNMSMQNSQTSLSDLKQCVQQAETAFKPTNTAVIAQLEDGQLQTLYSCMDSAAEFIVRGELYPLPGETIESVSAIVGITSRLASKQLDKLYSNLSDMKKNRNCEGQNETAALDTDLYRCAKDLMDSLNKLLRGARGIAALKTKSESSENLYEKQIEVIDCGKQIARSGEDVIQGVKLASVGALSLEELKKSIDQMKADIDNLVHRIPAYQEINSLTDKLQRSMQQFHTDYVSKTSGNTKQTSKSHSQLQSEFTAAVAIFNQTLNDLVNCNYNYSSISTLSNQLNESHSQMLEAGAMLISESPTNGQQLSDGLQAVSGSSSDLLSQLKLVLSASGSPEINLLKQSLLKAAGLVSDSVNMLLSTCASTLPMSQQICESCQRQLEAIKTGFLMEPPSMPLSGDSYVDCMNKADSYTHTLLSQMKRIPVACKAGDSNGFSEAVQTMVSVTLEMLKSATQANYHLGVIGSNTTPSAVCSSRADLIETITENLGKINDNCRSISSDDQSESKYRELANNIRKRTGNVCQLIKECINSSTDTNYQNMLLEAAKRLAEETANLIKTISASPRSIALANVEPGQPDSWSGACEGVSRAVEHLLAVAPKQSLDKPLVDITNQGREAQVSLHQASIDVVDGTVSLLRAAGALDKDAKSIPANQAFIINQKTLDNALNRLNNTIKFSAPGQKEFIEIEEELKHLLRNLDRASMDQNAPAKTNLYSAATVNNDLQRIQSSMKQFNNNIPTMKNLINSGKLDFLGKSSFHASSYLAPITESAIKLSSALPHSRDCAEIIELTKTVIEAFSATVEVCQKLTESQDFQTVHENLDSLEEGCGDLTKFVEGIASCHGNVENLVNAIQRSMERINATIDDRSFDIASSHTIIYQSVKAISDLLNEISAGRDKKVSRLQKKESMKKSEDTNQLLGRSKANDLNTSEKMLVQEYDNLVTGVSQIISSNPESSDKLGKAISSIGQSCIDVIRYEQSEFAGNMRSRLGDLMYALQSTSRGTQLCIAAVNEINQLLTDIDTSIMFASSGTLSVTSELSENDKLTVQTFPQIRDGILKNTRLLVSDLQSMVASVDGNQESFGMAAENVVSRFTQLYNSVKTSLVVIGNNPSLLGLQEGNEELLSNQTNLLNAVRDVAVALMDLFNSTKAYVTSGSQKDEECSRIKSNLEIMVSNVDTLVKSVKGLEDSGFRGTRALESALEAMRKEYRALEAWNPELGCSDIQMSAVTDESGVAAYDKMYSVQNLVLMTKPLVSASQKAVQALQTSKQEDVLIAANIGRKSVQDFARHLRVTVIMKLQQEKVKPSRIFNEKAPTTSAPDHRSSDSVSENTMKVVEHGKGAVKALIEMYENLNKGLTDGDKTGPPKMQMTLASRRINHSIHEVTQCATQLMDTDVQDTADPVSMAEDELLEAANQIEAAARKLSQIRPRKAIKKDTGEEMTFDNQILSACGSIVNATRHLVQMATVAQNELVNQGRLKPSNNNVSDQYETQWSHGLISAARLVAAATENLCDSAKALVQGTCGTERLISSSRQVASSTAHLLYACQVKADVNSESNQRLQAAGAAVKKATEMLVREASEHKDVQDGTIQESTGVLNKSMVSSMRDIIHAQAAILAKEKELEMLRSKYNTIRQEHISTHPELYSDE